MYNIFLIRCAPENRDLILGLLSANPVFDAFEETDGGLSAYVKKEDKGAAAGAMDEVSARVNLSYKVTVLEDKNWNEIWESQFEPIDIDDRLTLRASFHPPAPAFAQKILIDPRMAFGTGHHATTYMMCELMLDMDLTGKSVFDYGCGTGVLAILAKKLGAGMTHAVDIELPSYENTIENAATNGVEIDIVTHGTLDDTDPVWDYDVILANINRNVILATAAALYDRLKPEGKILFSGILAQDEQLLTEQLLATGFLHLDTRSREGWRAFVFSRV